MVEKGRFQNGFRGLIRVLYEGIGLAAVGQFEITRADLVNPSAGYFPVVDALKAAGKYSVEPLNPGLFAYRVLQNSGDLFDGFAYSFLVYNSLNLIDGLQSTITRKRIPECVKMGITAVVVSAGVIATETGIIQRGVADTNDIWAGLGGVGIYVGTHFLVSKLASRFTFPVRNGNYKSAVIQ